MAEFEQVRLHGYWTERVLARTPLLAAVRAVLDAAGQCAGAKAAARSSWPAGLSIGLKWLQDDLASPIDSR